MSDIISVRPLQYVHILDLTTNIEHVAVGPKTLVLQANEQRVRGPLPFIIVPPAQYCVVNDPCKKYEEGKPIILNLGHCDIRLHGEPFFLYPGESLEGALDFGDRNPRYHTALKSLPQIRANSALLLEARLDFQDGGAAKQAGDRWQIRGPCTYIPRPEVDIVRTVHPTILHKNKALRLRALQDTVDRKGKKRVTGEEWLMQEEGAYLPGTFEEVAEEVDALTLTDTRAVYLQATQTVEVMGRTRHAGEQWLLTVADTEAFIPPIGVEVFKYPVDRTVLRKNQYCVVLNPVDKNGVPQLGKKVVHEGVSTFFLHPGESLAKGIQCAYVLAENEALVITAAEEFVDKSVSEEGIRRQPGEKWMIHGPNDFIPSIHETVSDKRTAIAMSKNEGVYIRDVRSGEVRAVMGPCAYMLTENEVLFEKILPAGVENLLKKGGGEGAEDIRKIAYFEQSIDPAILKGRDKTRVVTYRCPGNTACQIFNFNKKTGRVIFGPDLVILGPHENFNVLSLSAGKPKKTDSLRSLALMLGPDFITDIIVVETSDHARLSVKMAFNNHFEYDKNKPEEASKLFSVPDFIGFACNLVASRIRSMVAQITFDEFHKHSAAIIQQAVFGKERTTLKFDANNLVISSIDIQSIEPVDLKMRDSLMKSVQMAIEISTKSIEASAGHEAARTEQAARGELDRQKLTNEQEAERERAILNELQAITAAVESTGTAVAEARAMAEKMKIEGQSEIEASTLKAEAENVEHSSELEKLTMMRTSELTYLKGMNDLELRRMKAHSDIEVSKFSRMVATMGKGTIAAIANAGPEGQVKLLQGLGISSVLFTDGSSPINLFDTAKGLISTQE